MRLLILLLLILLVVIRLIIYLQYEKFDVGENVNFEHTLLDNPRTFFDKQQIRIRNLFVTLPANPKVYYGDTVRISGTIEEQEVGLPQEDKKILVLNMTDIMRIEKINPFLSVAKFAREKVEKSFPKTLSNNQANLLIGIIFGVKKVFTEDFSQGLLRTGLLHVVAASGMNVSIVGGFLLAIFLRIFKRQSALIITVFGIFMYALLAGFQASILRASIMASISYVALVIGRQNYALISLVITSCLMFLITPFTIFDVGFQLSFAATFGIITIKPLFENLFNFKKFIFLEDFPTTFSAQLTTFPIIMSSFGNYSPVSLIVNILVLWTIPILMILGGVAAFLSVVLPVLAIPVLYLSMPFLLIFEKIVLFFSKSAFGITLPSFPTSLAIGYYLLLVAILLHFKKHE